MLSGKYRTLCLLLSISMLASLSFESIADDLKTLVSKAITDGESIGYLDKDVSAMIMHQTKSKEPVQFIAKRARKLSNECAELEILVNQPGVPMKDGKTGTTILMFKLPICLNGSYPEMLQALDDERKKKELSQCSQSIKKGAANDGFVEGVTEFKGCFKYGMVGTIYDGTCMEFHPGKNAEVKEFSFNKDGNLSIQMKLPKSCLEKENKWQLYFFERATQKSPRVLVGNRPISW